MNATRPNRRSLSLVSCLLIVVALNLIVVQLYRQGSWGNEKVVTPNCDDHRLPAPVEPSLQLAYRHSFGFFDDISDTDWIEYYQKPALAAPHYRWEDHDNKDVSAASWIFSNWDAYFACPHVRKIGGLGGGPKWTCDVERLARVVERRQSEIPEQSEHCLIYSIGSNGNYQWEDGLHEALGNLCEIHVFDPDPHDRFENDAKRMYFHQWGLGSSYSAEWMQRREESKGTYLSFPEIRQRLGHSNRTIDLFKIDCEGCEWHSYLDWIRADVRQVMMETHELPVVGKEKRSAFGILPAVAASTVFDTFYENGFVLFSKEVNSNSGLGRSSEWAFLKLHPDFFVAP